jgi:hypothetical protein
VEPEQRPVPREDVQATRAARRGRDLLVVEWIAIPAAIAVVLIVVFGLRFLLG